MSRLHIRFAAAALVVGLFTGVWTPARANVYVVLHDVNQAGSSDLLGTLDVGTGAFSEIAPLSTSGYTITGMGFGTDGEIYGLGYKYGSGTNGDLFRIDPTTGAATDLGQTGLAPVGGAITSSGVLFGIDGFNNNLSSVTPPSPSSTLIGTLPFSSDGLVAIGPDGHLYATGLGGNADGNLYRVDTTSAASTLVGNTGHADLYAGTFVGSNLYGFGFNTNEIVTIDTSTAATSQVATANLPSGYAVWAAATSSSVSIVPEPSSLAVGLVGGLALLGYRLRMKGKSRPEGVRTIEADFHS
jgi:hypothetical protein